MQTLPVTTEAVGTVQAEQTAAVTSRVVADVVDMRVSAGQRVAAGKTLVVLDNRDLQHRVEQAADAVRSAEATVAQARATLHATSRSSISGSLRHMTSSTPPRL